MNTVVAALANPGRVGLAGAGRIGTSHATLLARHVPGADLLAVTDPRKTATPVLVDKIDPR